MVLYMAPDGGYPRYIGDVQLEHPEFDGKKLPKGWREVKPSDVPEIPLGHHLQEVAPTEVDGELHQTFAVIQYDSHFLEAQEQHLKQLNEQIENIKKAKQK